MKNKLIQFLRLAPALLLMGGLKGQTCTLNASVSAVPTSTPGLSYTITGAWSGGTNTWDYINIWQTGAFFSGTDTVNYTFPGTGNYTVCYYVEDSIQSGGNGYCYDSTCILVSVNGGGATNCSSAFSSYANSGGNYTFQANTSAPPGWTSICNWNFGDGNYGSGNPAYHQYAVNGTYTVSLSVFSYDPSDSTQNCSSADTSVINVSNAGSGWSCQAGITTINYGAGNYTFLAASNTSNMNANPSASWYIDGSYAGSGDSLNATFTGTTVHLVCLQQLYVDPFLGDSCVSWACDSVLSSNAPGNCSVSVGGTYNSGANYSYWFIPSSGYASYTTSAVWYVDNVYAGTGDSVNTTYTWGGSHTVCADVWFFDSATGDTCFAQGCILTSWYPAGTSCQASFTLWQDTLNPTTWYGYNLSTAGPGASYLWDFGDGTTSTQQYPTHTYASTGYYLVCLTVSDTGNCSSTFCDSAGVFKLAGGISQLNILSAPASVKNIETETSVAVFPNPVTENSFLSISAARSMKINACIVNIAGGLVASEQVSISPGKNIIQLKTAELAPGIYFLNLTENGRLIRSIKLVK